MGLLTNTSAGERGAVASYLVTCWRLLVATLAVGWGSVCWWVRHYRYVAGVALVHAVLALVASLVPYSDRTGIPADVQVKISCTVFLLVPAVTAVVWARWWPGEFEHYIAGPWRRHEWRSWARSSWPGLARESGLSVQRSTTKTQLVRTQHHGKTNWVMEAQEVPQWVHPRLHSVTAAGEVLSLRAQCRMGQTIDDLEGAVPAIGTAAGAMSWRSHVESPSMLRVDLMMRDLLTTTRHATLPARIPAQVLDGVDKEAERRSPYVVDMGRRQDGTPWLFSIEERQTLVIGATGSGKGSVLWGLVGGLAPYVPSGAVALHGMDLKIGLELSMGKGLFTHLATTPEEAVDLLKHLVLLMVERGRGMAGNSRKHIASPGDPVHVLVIDELAMLLAYGPLDVRKEASALLAQLLTQGRALGFLVVAFAQDPRKEVIDARNLFTQKLALRLDSKTEVSMLLGPDYVDLARADRIPRTAQGTGWLIDSETGAVDKVRADYWDDRTIRNLARKYPAPLPPEPVVLDAVFTPDPAAAKDATTAETDESGPASETVSDASAAGPGGASSAGPGAARARKPRKPRAPRAPRQPRAPRADRLAPEAAGDGSPWGGEAA